ncbi:PilW family protein [Thalassolituus sp.]|uniref:PilW family protein n=1 Tax=Thalassolituus sp. TaxID=2030822 RepID=UPI003511A9D2
MKTMLRHQSGLTLVELMISMTLSLILIFAVGSILVTSNQTASVADTLADSQEAGRFAVDYMNRQLLRTGYSPEGEEFAPFAGLCAAPGDVICIDEAPDGTGDRLAVRRLAEPGESNAVTCYGSALLDADAPAGSAIVEDVVVTDVYWVAIDNNGLSSLRCQSFDENGTVRANAGDSFGDSQALAAGVLSIHVLYGQSDVAPIGGVNSVNRYLNADQVTDWDNVYAMRIGFLTQALTNTDGQAWEQDYLILDSTIYQFDDQTARQVFTTTVALLN